MHPVSGERRSSPADETPADALPDQAARIADLMSQAPDPEDAARPIRVADLMIGDGEAAGAEPSDPADAGDSSAVEDAEPAASEGAQEPAPAPTGTVTVEFAGEYFPVAEGGRFVVGREGELAIDDNLFLHRHFLEIAQENGLWWLANIGSRLTATVTDASGGVQAWLAPGARLPLVFQITTVVFSAGPTTYEFTIHATNPTFHATRRDLAGDGVSTIGEVPLTESQKLLLVALAEPLLRRDGTGMSAIPTSAAAAERLGWTVTRFNRKLDNVCDKFDRIGVPGMRGGARSFATNRRARLVEHVISSRLVTKEDLALLDAPQGDDNGAD